jgi:DNA polymerase/3'-5' exonuclease PolX
MYNEKLIKELTEIQEIAGIIGSIYREKAYRKAISEIKKLKFEITQANINDVAKMKIPGIGKGIMSKISEFITSEHISEIDELKKSREYTAYSEFSKIAGVGPATINEWIKKRIYNLRDLRKAISEEKVSLNNMQKYGLKYYDDLNERIPRAEVAAIGDYIKRILI